MFIFALPFFSFGIGSLFLLMMSMTADVIDLDELNTGLRREGTFGAIYWLMVKFGFAIAGGLSGLIMSSVGFDSGVALQPEGAVYGLRLSFSGIPILGTVIAMIVMRNYSVTEESAGEVRAELDKRIKSEQKPTSFYQTNKLATLLASGIEIDNSSDMDFTSKSEADIKALFSTSLNNGLHGLCFSPYLEGQNIGDQLSKAQITKRMDVIAPYTQWVRSFSCTEGNEHIPKVAQQKELKTMVGAWIGDDKTQNEKEIKALIKLGTSGFVDIAVVGNETLMREELNEDELIAYINRVKKALPGIPVGYVDAYYQFEKRSKLIDACDVILVNCYPFWEGCNIDQSATYLKQMYAVTQQLAKGKPVIITETGWPNKGDSLESAKPTENNAMKYFIDTSNWAQKNEIPLFYFSSFDESWKVHHEGDVGARWGIWDKNEKLKYNQ